MDSDLWDLPNLQELDLSGNTFTRLHYGLLQLPQFKRLDVSYCHRLVELPHLPASIAVFMVKRCESLVFVGDVSNCKWLWDVSLWRKNKVGVLGSDLMLDSMLQGNAIEDHFISFDSSGLEVPKRFVNKWVKGRTFRLQLPHNLYNDFVGFLICFVICNCGGHYGSPRITRSMKHQVVNKDSHESEVWHEGPNDYYYDMRTYVGYDSFKALTRDLTTLDLRCSIIFFSLEARIELVDSWLVAQLVPRKSNDVRVIPSNLSEFYDMDRVKITPFTVLHHSKSFVEILWCPHMFQ